MAVFVSEADVRGKLQLPDTVLVPSTLVLTSIDDAHVQVLRSLDPQFDVLPAEDALVLGEVLLSGAHLLRSIASQEAFSQKDISVGGSRFASGGRFASLMALAADLEVQAWFVLEPFLLEHPTESVALATDSHAVLGED